MGLAQTYLNGPDYLALHSLIHATFYALILLIQQSLLYTSILIILKGAMGHTSYDIPWLMAVVSFANLALPYVSTAYLALQNGVYNVKCNYTYMILKTCAFLYSL